MRKADPSRRQWLGLAGSAVMLASLTACDTPEPTRAEIEAFLKTSLPAGLSDLHATDEAGIDRMMRLRFDAPAAEAEAFAARLVPEGLEADADPGITTMGSGLTWWIETIPPGSVGGTSAPTHRPVVKILALPLPSGLRRIWVAAFTT